MNKILTMAALALMTAACSNDDTDIQTPVEQPAKSEGIPFTATISIGENAMTRALTEDATNNQIVPTWAAGEKVALIHNGVNDEMSVASVSGGVATITGTITGSPTTGDAVTIIYPSTAADGTTGNVKANLLAAQDGTLATIAANYDVRKGTGTLKVSGTASLNGNVSLTNQNAIFKFTLQDLSAAAKSATEFKVSDNSGNVMTTVTLGSASDVLYVVLPAMTKGTYWFNATIDSKPYIAKATTAAATEAGKYYQTTVKMATLGDLMGQDGKFYANADAITAPTKAIGVIGYLGNDATTEAIANGGGHGLVLCLKDAESGVAWSTEYVSKFSGQEVTSVDGLKRTENVSGYTNTATLTADAVTAAKYPAAKAAKEYTTLAAPTGTTGWFLPSAQQWVKMIEGLGALEENSITWQNWFDTNHTAADKWETALSKAGSGNYDSMTSSKLYFWSSSEYSDDGAVVLVVDATGTGSGVGFLWNGFNKDQNFSNRRVRPVLAF